MERSRSFPIYLIALVMALPVSAQTVYVDDDAPGGGDGNSWTTAFTFLQDALEAARQDASIVEIRVAGGVYRPDDGALVTEGDAGQFFELVSGVSLLGGFAGLSGEDPDRRDLVLHPSELNGDLGENDPADLMDNTARLLELFLVDVPLIDGFIIRGANARGFGTGGFGGGARVGRSTATMSRCQFLDNHAEGGGAAISVTNVSVTPRDLILVNCLFQGNSAGPGPGIGGAISAVDIDAGIVEAVNCTFVENNADSTGGAIRAADVLRMENCVVAANTAGDGLQINAPPDLDVTYSCIEGGFAGEGNVTPPLDLSLVFLDPANHDYRLVDNSPCADSGNNAALDDGLVPEGERTDVEGTERFLDSDLPGGVGLPGPVFLALVDMGAYESPGLPSYAGDPFWISPDGGSFGCFLNWFPGTPVDIHAPLFDLDAGYDVSFDFSPINDRLLIGTGAITFELSGQTYELAAIEEPSFVMGLASGDVAALTLMSSQPFGDLVCRSARIADAVDSASTVTVTGADASWIVMEDLVIGDSGNGQLVIADGALVVSRDASVGANPTSSGSVQVTGAGSIWSVPFFMEIDNGVVHVADGGLLEVAFGAVFMFDRSQLTGNGTIDADVFNFGDVAPSGGIGSVGALTVLGDYEQIGQVPFLGLDSGGLRLDIAGETAGADHDLLDVLGTVELGGGLFLSVDTGGFDPQVDDTFTVVQSGQEVQGAFDLIFTTGLPTGLLLTVQDPPPLGLGPTEVTLVVQDFLGQIGFDDPDQFGIDGVPSSALLQDLDGDTFPDLAVTVPSTNSILVLFNDTTAADNWLGFNVDTIQEIPVGTGPSDIATGLIDGDGAFDLAVTNAGDGTVTVLINDGAGQFDQSSVTVGQTPTAVTIDDLDGVDGPDLAVANFGDDTVSILFNDGTGVFPGEPTTVSVSAGPADIASGELDGEAGVDLVVAQEIDGTVSILGNDGAGNFTVEMVIDGGDCPGVLDPEDLDNDKDIDLITGNPCGRDIGFILNGGDGTFAPAVTIDMGDGPASITTLDMDGDGDQDVAVVVNDTVDGRLVRVLRNDLVGNQLGFSPSEDLAEGLNPVLVLSGDLDQDGIEDLVTVSDDAGGGASPENGPVPGSVDVLLNVTDETPCPADCAAPADGEVGVVDLLALLADWGGPGACDLDGSGTLDVNDLLDMLAAWGACR